MNLKSAITFILFATLLPITAEAACHFNTNNAIVCRSAESAAYAFKNFGFDSKRTDLSYNRTLLQQAGCGRAYNPNYQAAVIKQMQIGKIATPNGWVKIISAEINDTDIYYFAKAYVTGTCDKYDAGAPFVMGTDGRITRGTPPAPASSPAATN